MPLSPLAFAAELFADSLAECGAGLNLGAVGMALKLVVFNLLMTHIYELANARYLKISFMKLFFMKIRMAAAIALGGLICFGSNGIAPKIHHGLYSWLP